MQLDPLRCNALICYTNNDTVLLKCLINLFILEVAPLSKAKIKLILSELEKMPRNFEFGSLHVQKRKLHGHWRAQGSAPLPDPFAGPENTTNVNSLS